MKPRQFVRLLVCVMSIALAPNAVASAAPYPVSSFEQMLASEAMFVATGQDPAQSPPGVNVPGCTPTAAHPVPVILLHGFPANQYNGFAHLGPTLANAGYCVYALNHGGTNALNGGIARAAESAGQLSAFVDAVRSWTGAAQVDLIGHSGGAFVSLLFTKTGAAGRVGKVVAMAPPTHGITGGTVAIATNLGLRGAFVLGCPICEDVSVGSAAMTLLNTGPIAQPGITYTTIVSTHDSMVSPVSVAAIEEPGVTNIVVQDVCPADPVGHSGLAFDSTVDSLILNALDPANSVPVTCGAGPSI